MATFVNMIVEGDGCRVLEAICQILLKMLN